MTQFYERLRVAEFDTDLVDGKFRVEISLSWDPDREYRGSAEGADSVEGRLMAGAEAAARALEQALGNQVSVAVRGLEQVEKLNSVVSLIDFESAVEKRSHELVGSCLVRDTPERAAAYSVLDATNQLLGSNLQYLKFRARD